MFKRRSRKRPGLSPVQLMLIVIAMSGALLLFLKCGPQKSQMDRRKDVFLDVASRVNGPIRALAPLHARILPPDQGPVMFLDAQIKACFEAEPLVLALGSLTLPPDEMGRPLSAEGGVRDATAGFHEGMKACRAPGGASPEQVSQCLLRCMGDWAALVRAVDQMRKDADWVGVRVESIAPLQKREE